MLLLAESGGEISPIHLNSVSTSLLWLIPCEVLLIVLCWFPIGILYDPPQSLIYAVLVTNLRTIVVYSTPFYRLLFVTRSIWHSSLRGLIGTGMVLRNFQIWEGL